MKDPLITKTSNDDSESRATNAVDSKKEKVNFKNSFLFEVIKFVALVVFVVLPFRALVAQPFMVSGVSMEPTFRDNDYLIVNQLSKRLGNIERYDVIVFKAPTENTRFYIKRVIGLPGETIEIKEGITTVTLPESTDPIKINDTYTQGETLGQTLITLGSDEYFVMGDNRQNSSDSRIWGPLPSDNIVGTPLVRLYPFSDINLNPGTAGP